MLRKAEVTAASQPSITVEAAPAVGASPTDADSQRPAIKALTRTIERSVFSPAKRSRLDRLAITGGEHHAKRSCRASLRFTTNQCRSTIQAEHTPSFLEGWVSRRRGSVRFCRITWSQTKEQVPTADTADVPVHRHPVIGFAIDRLAAELLA